MSSLTPLNLPESAPFPVKISAIHAQKGQRVSKHEPLLTYTYWEYQDAPEAPDASDEGEESLRPKKIRVDLVGTFESPIDCVVEEVSVRKGDEVLSADTEVAKVLEPCTHSIQYGGLCALCGKSLEDETDYSGYKYEDRAPISMSHGTSNLKVSKDEAEKVEEKWQKSLIAEKKLILVVDLDQTVIHATVDPTIGEWMKDESNPNYPSLKDVKTFELEEEHLAMPYFKGQRPQIYARTYYVKLRPGLEEFLERVSQKYELHIYTMGTRSYAKSIATCIDPEGKYFADRILSRDESGSITHKSLERLFPTDTSMVVIIDDRGDVWNWSDHLVKVVPFDFFVGIGDINSNFLPKQKALLGPSKRKASIAKLEEKLIGSQVEETEKKENEDDEREEEKEEEEDETTLSEEQSARIFAERNSEREATLEAQEEERPMAKLQKNLDDLASHSERLLYDDDDDLKGLEKGLLAIHEEFYKTLENSRESTVNVKDILPKMKSKIFNGCHFSFSGLFPIGSNIDNESIVIWARSFGATVSAEVTMDITHIIAKNPYTFKAKLAKTLIPTCKIMHPDWLFDCMTNWRRAPESEYEVEFKSDKILPEEEVRRYMKNLEKSQTVEAPSSVSVDGNGTSQNNGNDLLGGDMDWLNEEDEEDEEFLSSDSDEEAQGNTMKRSIDDGHDEDSKRRRLELDVQQADDDEEEDDDDDDDDFAAELMNELNNDDNDE